MNPFPMTYTLKTIAMKRILIIGALLGGFFAAESQAQDLRFTQYNAIPAFCIAMETNIITMK